MPTKFDFVSPGIELREIDQSQVTPVPEEDGLLLIGRSRKGPAMKPIKVNSLENFIDVFGNPMDGVKSQDPWRDGNTGAPSYAGYAAQAYLASGVGPVKFIRLAGLEEAGATGVKKAGWNIEQTDFSSPPASPAAVESAVGIFVAPNASVISTVAASASIRVTDSGAVFDGETFILTDVDGLATTYTIRATVLPADGGGSGGSAVVGFSGIGGGSAGKIALSNSIAIAINATTDANYTAVADGVDTVTVTQGTLGLAGNTTSTDAISGVTVSNFVDGAAATPISGTLAAVFYMSASNITLSGTGREGATIAKQGATAIVGGTNGWTAFISGSAAGLEQEFEFNFDPSSENFIRNVFNTDATEFESGTGDYNLNYFLGESFEHAVNRLGSSTGLFAFTAGIVSGSSKFTDWQSEATAAKSGWFISKKPDQKKLFRLVALEDGADFHKNYVVRIKDIRAPTTLAPNATFALEIAKVGSNASTYVEKFSNLNMNPTDPNYIVKRIGNLNQVWDKGLEKVMISGEYSNNSNLVRVEIPSVASGISSNGGDYPVGFLGPKAPVGAATILEADAGDFEEWIRGKEQLPQGQNNRTIDELSIGDSLEISWPQYGLSVENSNIRNGNYAPGALLGLSYAGQKGDENFGDLGLLRQAAAFDPHLDESAANSGSSFIFTLDEIKKDTAGKYYFEEAASSGTETLSDLFADGVKQFVAPFFGGFDGLNIKLQNPFNKVQLDAGGSAEYSMQTALSMVSDRDVIRYDLISIPGVTNKSVNQDLIAQTEARGDALAIIDIEGIYSPAADTGGSEEDQVIANVITNMNAAGYDSSYAAAYYPNVRLGDTLNGNGTVLKAPPSVAALGAIGKSEADSQPWFAPAGFQRGGLNPLGGALGPQVLGTVEHLTKADRDSLYEVNINPIARFPATGDTVIFGQKTLQQSASALDRINVRRLMNYLKKEIGDIADTILFDQNVQATWNRFKTKADRVLSQVKSDFGVTEYKLVLDETTTTPDLQDRNILYAKVFVKPARSIEFIAVDFVITQSGIEL